jgi:hypothetical protein
MKKQYFIALIEADTDKLNEGTGKVLVEQMTALKELVDPVGSCDYYHVKDIKAMMRFKAELKRLNP